MGRTRWIKSKESNPSIVEISSRRRSWLGRLGVFSLGLVAGIVANQLDWATDSATSARDTVSGRGRSSESIAQTEQHILASGSLAVESRTTGENLLEGWFALAESERLRSLAIDVKGAGLDFIARGVVDQLSDDSLVSLIASTTDFSPEELAEIGDVSAFALGLARVAMDGTVRDAATANAELRAIDFSTDITWDHRADGVQSQFSTTDERIYAVFQSDELGLTQTLAKWTRVDTGEIMLFKRHAIRPAADSSFVWLDAPAGGWAPGEYRVDFYSADTGLHWVASGEHRISF